MDNRKFISQMGCGSSSFSGEIVGKTYQDYLGRYYIGDYGPSGCSRVVLKLLPVCSKGINIADPKSFEHLTEVKDMPPQHLVPRWVGSGCDILGDDGYWHAAEVIHVDSLDPNSKDITIDLMDRENFTIRLGGTSQTVLTLPLRTHRIAFLGSKFAERPPLQIEGRKSAPPPTAFPAI